MQCAANEKVIGQQQYMYNIHIPVGSCWVEWMILNCLGRTRLQRESGTPDPAVTCLATVKHKKT